MKNDPEIFALLQRGIVTVDDSGHVFWHGRPVGHTNKKGYLRIRIWRDNRRLNLMCHRIVWIANHGLPPTGMPVDHVDMCKTNNSPHNLRLVSTADNIRAAANMGAYDRVADGRRRDERGRFL